MTSAKRCPRRILLKVLLMSSLGFNLFPEYKNIIFDFGGVILAGGPQHGSTIVTSAPFCSWMNGQISLEQVRNQLSLCHNPMDVEKIFTEILSLDRPWIDETIQVIKTLKKNGYRIYLLSNLAQEVRDRFMFHPVFSYFDGAVYSCEVNCSKPDAHIYCYLLEKYNLSSAESIFIDDAIKNIVAAQGLGFTGIVYTPGNLMHILQAFGIQV